ncbi:hypothetical protein KKG65_01125 [Patescibacteria group bacterium]|nr:hypothetical protein [Patescibacteria group bacterium]
MDENGIERSGGKSFLNFLKPKKDIVKKIFREEFEKGLFSGGVYHFDFERDVRDLEMDVTRAKAWYDNNPGWDEKRTADSLVRDINDARYNLTWRSQFDGQIPQSWLNWIDARDNFEAAGKSGWQLSDELINAGVTHPVHHVAREVGKSQKLNMAQLVAVLARPGIPKWGEDEIIESQQKKGLRRADLREARTRADEIKRKMREKDSGKKELKKPWLGLTTGR